ncbi:MAG: LEA type 2 family protein [Cyclobacteriaceae bacterium]
MKKGLAIFFALLLIGILGYFLVKNQLEKPAEDDTFLLPELKVASIQIKSFEEKGIDLELALVIDNKMPISLQLDSVSYRIELEDKQIVESTYPDSISLEASDSSTISLPVTVQPDSIIQGIENANQENKDSLRLEVHTTFLTNLPVAQGPHDLSLNSRIPFIRKPDIVVENVRLEKLGLNQSNVDIKIRVINPNKIPFAIENTVFQFNVNKDELVSGDFRERTELAAEDTATFTIPVKIDVGQVGETAFNLLFNPGNTNYTFSMNTRLESDVDMIDNSSVVVRNNGKLRELIN